MLECKGHPIRNLGIRAPLQRKAAMGHPQKKSVGLAQRGTLKERQEPQDLFGGWPISDFCTTCNEGSVEHELAKFECVEGKRYRPVLLRKLRLKAWKLLSTKLLEAGQSIPEETTSEIFVAASSETAVSFHNHRLSPWMVGISEQIWSMAKLLLLLV